MKFVFAILFLIVGVCTLNKLAVGKYTCGHDGKPECLMNEEQVRAWRHNLDPTKYWICADHGVAIEEKCPSCQMFMDAPETAGCIDWDEWEYFEPYDPPSVK